MAETAARLSLCVVLPEKFTAHSRVRFSCPHGAIKETTVLRFVEREYCCKSQASKAHPADIKREAALARWAKPGACNPPQKKETNLKRSITLTSTLAKLKEQGWVNPGWGWKPQPSEWCKPGTLYWITYADEMGEHFKVGITKLELLERFKREQVKDAIKIWHSTLGRCWQVEQASLRMARKYGWRYSSSSTTELIHAKEAARFHRIVEVLWLIYPWDEPKLAKDVKLNPYHPAGHALQPLGNLLFKVRSAQTCK